MSGLQALESVLDRARALGPPRAPEVRVSIVWEWWRPGASAEVRVVPWGPRLLVGDLFPAELDPELAATFLNGEALATGRVLYTRLAPGDALLVVNVPGLPAGGIGALVLQIVLSAAASAALAFVAAKILSPSEQGRDPNDSASVYGWEGIRTNYNAVGMPVPLIYGGPIRTGGLVIYESVEIVDGAPPESYLKLIILLAAGPIEEIGGYTADQDLLAGAALPEGMQINGNAAVNFDDVEVSIRMGTAGQSVVPGFESIETFYSVGLVIDNSTAQSGNPPVTDWSLAAVFDMPAGATAERVRLGLRFPSGLFTSSGGSVLPHSIDVQVRYIELDEFGAPVGSYQVVDWTGQPGGIGDTLTISAAQASAYAKQVPFPVIDPDDWTPPTPGLAVVPETVAQHYGDADIVNPLSPKWVFDGTIDEITIFGVVQMTDDRQTNPLVAHGHFPATFRGWAVEFPGGAGLGSLRFRWGNGVTQATLTTGVTQPVGVYFSFACVRRKEGSSWRNTLYINGAIVATQLTGVSMTHASSGVDMRWIVVPGQESATDLDLFFGAYKLDDVRIYDRELSTAEIAGLHNGGVWGEGPDDENDVVWASRFEDVQQAFGGLGAFRTKSYVGPDIFWKPDVTHQPTVETGVVLQPATGNTRQIRLRVEVQRLDVVTDSTSTKDTVFFDHLIAILDDEVAYVGWSIAAVRARATDQLNSSRPTVSFLLKGRNDLPIWDELDPTKPTFAPGFSRQPAWHLAGLCLDRKYGGGQYFDTRDFDWESLRDHAAWGATLVWDQKGRFVASQLAYSASEPGFSGAVYQIRLDKPTVPHFFVGKEIRITATGDADYPTGDFTIAAVVSIDDDNYELWLDWPTGVPVPTPNPFVDANAANLEGLRERIAENLILADRGVTFWDAVNIICAVGRTAPTRVGNQLRLKIEDVRQPIAVFGPSNIALETFRISGASPGESFSIAVGEISDEDLDFERNAIARPHSSLKTGTSSTTKRKTKVFDLRGVTNAAQARVELDLLVNLNQADKLWCEFEAAIDALFLAPGDVCAVAFPVPWNRFGGRVLADSKSGNLLTEPEDFSTWDLNADALTPVEVAVAAPAEVGATKVYEHSTTPTATNFAAASQTEGVLPPDGSYTFWGLFFKKHASADEFRLNVRDDDTPTSYVADFEWIAGVPTETFSHAEITSRVTASVTADWYFVEIRLQTPAGKSGNAREVFFYVPSTSGPFPNMKVHVSGGFVRESANAEDWIEGEWARGQAIQIDVPIEFESGKSYSLACRDDDSDAIAIVAVDDHSVGILPAGSVLRLDAPLGFSPKKGAPWVFGESALAGALFQVVSSAAGQRFRNRLRLVTYDSADYPDPDTIDVIASTESPPGGTPSPKTGELPDPPLDLRVIEEAIRDADSGTLRRTLYVAWTPSPTTVRRISHTNVWLRDEASGLDSMVGRVDGPRTVFRIPENTLLAGTSYSIAIQEVTRDGTRRSLLRAPRVALTARGAWPVPVAPTGLSQNRVGDRLYYYFTAAQVERNAFFELRRGGIFVGDEVCMIPALLRGYGPTEDWARWHDDADGNGSPTMFLRTVLPNGVKGAPLRVEGATPAIPTGGEIVVEEYAQDNGWDNAFTGGSAPVKTRVQTNPATAFLPESISFSSGTDFIYDFGSIVLGRARAVHVSFAIEGYQIHPKTVEEFVLPNDDPAFASWTVEGPTDPNDPDYGECEVRLLCKWTGPNGGSPGYERWRNGIYHAKTFFFRLRVFRPTTDWDVRIFRAGIRIAELAPRTIDGGEL